MERQPTTDRMIQEYVPGKQVTLAHLIANPGKIFKKLGLQDAVYPPLASSPLRPARRRLSPRYRHQIRRSRKLVFLTALPAPWC